MNMSAAVRIARNVARLNPPVARLLRATVHRWALYEPRQGGACHDLIWDRSVLVYQPFRVEPHSVAEDVEGAGLNRQTQ